MNKSQFIEELSRRLGYDKNELRTILEEINGLIAEKVKDGEKVCLQGFGSYTPRLQTSRPARNPKTGAPVMLVPRTIIHFKCSPIVLEDVNYKDE